MAKFTLEQAADVLAIKQAIYDWGDELDMNSGLKMRERDCLAEDVRYFVGGEWREGLPAVEAFYRGRADAQLAGAGLITMRHIITSLRVSFDGADHAKIGFLLVFFAALTDLDKYCDPLAVADVKMEATRGADGEWRISMFDSGQIFKRG